MCRSACTRWRCYTKHQVKRPAGTRKYTCNLDTAGFVRCVINRLRPNSVCLAPETGAVTFTSSVQDSRSVLFSQTGFIKQENIRERRSVTASAAVNFTFHLIPLRLSELLDECHLGFVQLPALVQDFSSDHIFMILGKTNRVSAWCSEFRHAHARARGIQKPPKSKDILILQCCH